MTNHQFTPQPTGDGSFTFFSPEFAEAFHSRYGAKQEAEAKFAAPTLIKEKALALRGQPNAKIQLLDVCYGLGYNSAAAMEIIWSANPQCQIELIGLEISAAVPRQAIAYKFLEQWNSPIPQLLANLAANFQVKSDCFDAKLLLGDARQTIQSVCQQQFKADAVFLDPFSPPKCPQLWTIEFLALVAQCLKPTGKLTTYSCAAAVRTALSLAGLQFGSTPGVGRRAPGTIASFSAQNLPPLSVAEQEHLATRAAIPYRDPYLRDSAEKIHQTRQQEQQSSSLESTSQWKKRWLLI